jgi:antitoxin (DNA-binding transcriptional repressor) of toxin-antitoxin stability system
MRINPGKVWKLLKSAGEIIITVSGKPVALLSNISEATLEDDMRDIRRAKAISATARIRNSSRKRGTHKLTMAQIDAEIDKTRKLK